MSWTRLIICEKAKKDSNKPSRRVIISLGKIKKEKTSCTYLAPGYSSEQGFDYESKEQRIRLGVFHL